MKLTKEERKTRRRGILKKVVRGVGGVAGIALDVVPIPGISKLPKAVKQFIPQMDLDDDLAQDNYMNDVIPLIRTIKTLRVIIERLLARLGWI